MKGFQHLTDDEFKALPPDVRRSCGECGHLFSAVSWWCGSKEAIQSRGTRIPGICNCQFWNPMPKRFLFKELFNRLLNTSAS